MPRIKIAEQCGRCPREELVEVNLEQAVARFKEAKPKAKALAIVVDGELLVSYDHLCDECRGIVVSYVEGTKKQDKRSARRFKREPSVTDAPRVRPRSRPQASPLRPAGASRAES